MNTIADRYVLHETLGSGGFGTTFRGVDSTTGGEVAVKRLDLTRITDWKAVELFEREAHVLEQLDHPRIPRYIDFIPVRAEENGYLIQELAPGVSIATRLEAAETFDEVRARQIARQILEILIYLADQNPPVVHRDIKPGNLLLDASDDVYLVDFGSVKDAAKQTFAGGSTVAGTFGYMAPEQLHGAATARSDLYGLGMTMIHMLSGSPPESMQKRRLRVDFRQHTSVSSDFADFLDRLIDPMPEDRFSSAQHALDALENLGNHALVPAGPAGSEIARRIADDQAREKRALESQRRSEVARVRGADDRIAVATDDQGVTIRVAPRSRIRAFLIQLPIFLFLLVNPGFVVVGGFPFFGPAWPFFADFWLGRAVVWSVFLILLSTAIAWFRTPPEHLRLTRDGHFSASKRSHKRPFAYGFQSELSVDVTPATVNELGRFLANADSGAMLIEDLTDADIRKLESVLNEMPEIQ